MKPKFARVVFVLGLLILRALIPTVLHAQVTGGLSGVAMEPSGKTIPNAKISIKNLGTGQSAEAQTDMAGRYNALNLAPGDYAVSIFAEGFGSKEVRVTVNGTGPQSLDLVLNPVPAQQAPANKPPQELPNAPSNAPASPSLEDLGFKPEQTQANAQLQTMLEKRTRMLKTHQRLGLITAIPMAAAVITGPMAKAKGKNGETIKEPTTANIDFHAALGGVTTALYFSTAYYAIWAPRVPGTKKHGAIRVHEALAFIHGPGMILTPVLGYMAYKQENSGEKAHGIAGAHGTVAYVTAAAYGASIVAVSWPIHWKFWEKQ
jgi:Carboxypeptidase regulatory-like domain